MGEAVNLRGDFSLGVPQALIRDDQINTQITQKSNAEEKKM